MLQGCPALLIDLGVLDIQIRCTHGSPVPSVPCAVVTGRSYEYQVSEVLVLTDTKRLASGKE